MRAERISESLGRPSRLMKPPGIFPAAYCRSRYSTVSGKNGSGLWFSLTVTAARTIVSPNCTRADPAACFAMPPVSITSFRPANVFSTRCFIAILPQRNAKRGLHRLRPRDACVPSRSIPEPEFLNDSAIAVDVSALHVIQQAATTSDHLQQATPAVMVFLVNAEVIVEVFDPIRENRHLHPRRSGVPLRGAILLNCCGFVESHAVKSPPRVRSSDDKSD